MNRLALTVVTSLLLFVTLLLPLSASATNPTEGAGNADATHASAADAAAHKEHLRHFSLWNILVSSTTEKGLREKLGALPNMDKSFYDKEDFVSAGHISHVFWAGVSLAIVLLLAFLARGRLGQDADAGVLPERKLSPLLFFEVLVGSTYGLMKDMMGPDLAKRYIPIIGTLAVYIFVMNCMALLPFGAPATDNLNTNAGMALTVFFATHWAGLRVQGPVHYLKHFMGPVLALAPLFFVIEIVGHLARPLSLSLRLMGNMTGDHNVLFEFLYFKIPLFPLPVMILGLLVCVVQTMVFVILSTVYLAMATDAGHGDEAHAH
jgi:F-type H+-transporting ATPase subunit a